MEISLGTKFKNSPTAHLTWVHPQSEFLWQAQVTVQNAAILTGFQDVRINSLKLVDTNAPITKWNNVNSFT